MYRYLPLLAGLASAYPSEPRAAVWKPEVGTKWQIVLESSIVADSSVKPDVPIYDIDLYTNTNDGKDAERVIGKLHDQGKKVICYFSAGTYEPDRPDSDRFEDSDLGAKLPDWPKERWLDIRHDNVRNIIKDRIDIAADMGCDAIDPDNMDGYDNENGGGFSTPLTEQDSVDLVRWMAQQAAGHGMAIGLKNALSIIEDVVDVVDFAVNEECVDWKECSEVQPFIEAGKPVFHIEYPEGAGSDSGLGSGALGEYCNARGTDGFSTVIKNYSLDGWVQYCDGSVDSTEMS